MYLKTVYRNICTENKITVNFPRSVRGIFDVNCSLRLTGGDLALLYKKYRSPGIILPETAVFFIAVFSMPFYFLPTGRKQISFILTFPSRQRDLDTRSRAYALCCLLSRTIPRLITCSSSQQLQINRSDKLHPVLCRTDHILHVLFRPRSYVRGQVLHSRQSHCLPVL